MGFLFLEKLSLNLFKLFLNLSKLFLCRLFNFLNFSLFKYQIVGRTPIKRRAIPDQV